MELVLIAAAVTAYVAWRRRTSRRERGGAGAGASAMARAAVLRRQARGGPGRRVLAWVGLDASGDRRRAEAARWEAGAAGERETAALLAGLGPGWHVLHDRALPGSRANVDHLVVSPGGGVVMPDTKQWSARYRVGVRRGRLHHGTHDRQQAVESALFEARTVSRLLGVPVTPLLAVRGAPIDGGELVVHGSRERESVRVIPADRLPEVLRAEQGRPDRTRAAELARRAQAKLPPHHGG